MDYLKNLRNFNQSGMTYDPMQHDMFNFRQMADVYGETATDRLTVDTVISSIDAYDPIKEGMLLSEQSKIKSGELDKLGASLIDILKNRNLAQRSVGKGFAGSGGRKRMTDRYQEQHGENVQATLSGFRSMDISTGDQIRNMRTNYIDSLWDLYSTLQDMDIGIKEKYL